MKYLISFVVLTLVACGLWFLLGYALWPYLWTDEKPPAPVATSDCMSDGRGNRLCWNTEQGFFEVGSPRRPCIVNLTDWVVCRMPDGKWWKMEPQLMVEESPGNQ